MTRLFKVGDLLKFKENSGSGPEDRQFVYIVTKIGREFAANLAPSQSQTVEIFRIGSSEIRHKVWYEFAFYKVSEWVSTPGQLLRGNDSNSYVFGKLFLLLRIRYDEFFVESDGIIFDVFDFSSGQTQGWISTRFEKVE